MEEAKSSMYPSLEISDGYILCPIKGCPQKYETYNGLLYHLKVMKHERSTAEELEYAWNMFKANSRLRQHRRATFGESTKSLKNPEKGSRPSSVSSSASSEVGSSNWRRIEKRRRGVKSPPWKPTKSKFSVPEQKNTEKHEYTHQNIFPRLNVETPLAVRYSNDQENENESKDEKYQGTKDVRYTPLLSKVNDTIGRLPKASVRQLEKDASVAWLYRKVFQRPSSYIRFVELSPEKQYLHVEYDMDDEDQFWLEDYNEQERISHSLAPVTANIFELLMDRLEKEWSYRMRLRKEMEREEENRDDVFPSSEESACNICNDGECENSNAIVFCDGCNLAVHQDCYGVPYIPEGQWLCRKCLLAPEKTVKCIFCPNQGGAMKQTVDNRWGHVLCAFWIPEVGFANTVYMEPIDCIEHVSKERWRLKCYICHKRQGACIQCAHRNCYIAFHVTCARNVGIHLAMKHDGHVSDVKLKAYCAKHVPERKEDELFPSSDSEGEDLTLYGDKALISDEETKVEKQTTHHHRHNSLVHQTSSNQMKEISIDSKKSTMIRMLLIVPPSIFEKLLQALNRFQIQKKSLIVTALCKYWSLKRQSRRGAPLLKRLIYQATTVTAPTVVSQGYEVMEQRKEALTYLRQNLEKLRSLADLIRRREKMKQSFILLKKEMVNLVFHPLAWVLKRLLNCIQLKLDPKDYFAQPVSAEQVPDYLDVIKQPMDFGTMSKKLELLEYETLEVFREDLNLVCTNAMVYNRTDTVYYRCAARIKLVGNEWLDQAASHLTFPTIDPIDGHLTEAREDFLTFVPEIHQTIPENEDTQPISENHIEDMLEPLQVTVPSPEEKENQFNFPKNSVTSQKPQHHHLKKLKRPQPTKIPERTIITRHSFSTLSSSTPPIAKKGKFTNSPQSSSLATTITTAMSSFSAVQFKHGDVVWAKMYGFPWHPAHFHDFHKEPVPKHVMNTRPTLSSSSPSKSDYNLVFFIEPKRTWAWLTSEFIQPLGIHPDLDQQYLLQSKRKKNHYLRVKNAYQQAYAQLNRHVK